jgi:hypothetical protein
MAKALFPREIQSEWHELENKMIEGVVVHICSPSTREAEAGGL